MPDNIFDTIIEKLKTEARNSWTDPAIIGEERAQHLEGLIRQRIPQYAKALGLTEAEVLLAMENKRTWAALNYYEKYLQPIDRIRVFDSQDSFFSEFPSGKYRCPSCGGISSDPYECDTGIIIKNISTGAETPCNWKAYGLFGTMGKGLSVLLKKEFIEHPHASEIFLPIELESTQ